MYFKLMLFLEEQPLAEYVHCGAHVANLIMQHSVGSVRCIRNSLHAVNELGVLFKRSGKLKVCKLVKKKYSIYFLLK